MVFGELDSTVINQERDLQGSKAKSISTTTTIPVSKPIQMPKAISIPVQTTGILPHLVANGSNATNGSDTAQKEMGSDPDPQPDAGHSSSESLSGQEALQHGPRADSTESESSFKDIDNGETNMPSAPLASSQVPSYNVPSAIEEGHLVATATTSASVAPIESSVSKVDLDPRTPPLSSGLPTPLPSGSVHREGGRRGPHGSSRFSHDLPGGIIDQEQVHRHQHVGQVPEPKTANGKRTQRDRAYSPDDALGNLQDHGNKRPRLVSNPPTSTTSSQKEDVGALNQAQEDTTSNGAGNSSENPASAIGFAGSSLYEETMYEKRTRAFAHIREQFPILHDIEKQPVKVNSQGGEKLGGHLVDDMDETTAKAQLKQCIDVARALSSELTSATASIGRLEMKNKMLLFEASEALQRFQVEDRLSRRENDRLVMDWSAVSQRKKREDELQRALEAERRVNHGLLGALLPNGFDQQYKEALRQQYDHLLPMSQPVPPPFHGSLQHSNHEQLSSNAPVVPICRNCRSVRSQYADTLEELSERLNRSNMEVSRLREKLQLTHPLPIGGYPPGSQLQYAPHYPQHYSLSVGQGPAQGRPQGPGPSSAVPQYGAPGTPLPPTFGAQTQLAGAPLPATNGAYPSYHPPSAQLPPLNPPMGSPPSQLALPGQPATQQPVMSPVSSASSIRPIYPPPPPPTTSILGGGSYGHHVQTQTQSQSQPRISPVAQIGTLPSPLMRPSRPSGSSQSPPRLRSPLNTGRSQAQPVVPEKQEEGTGLTALEMLANHVLSQGRDHATGTSSNYQGSAPASVVLRPIRDLANSSGLSEAPRPMQHAASVSPRLSFAQPKASHQTSAAPLSPTSMVPASETAPTHRLPNINATNLMSPLDLTRASLGKPPVPPSTPSRERKGSTASTISLPSEEDDQTASN